MGATLQINASTSEPGSLPIVQVGKRQIPSSSRRAPQSANGILYVTVTTNEIVSSAMPTFSSNSQISGVAFYNPLLDVWQYTYTASGGTYSATGSFFLQTAQAYTFALYTGAPTVNPTPTPVAGSAAPLPPIATYGGVLWAPYAVANAYQYPVQSGYDGTGWYIAIVGDYPPAVSDIQGFTSTFGITGHSGTIATVNVDGGSPMTDTAGQQEATLDAETVAGLAPGSKILFYSTPDLSGQSLIDAFELILEQGEASVVSLSFGSCESGSSGAALSLVDEIIAQGTANGVAFVISSGDTGDRCNLSPTTTQFGVAFPASDPNVISVGGLETVNGSCQASNITASQVWNDFCFTSGQGASGGGVSSYFTIPSWQVGLTTAASQTYRNVPDIAMPAVFAGVYLNGSWTGIGGTSWAAPQAAALILEVYEWCNTRLVPPALIPYYVFAQHGYTDFLSIGSSNNDFSGDSAFYAANGNYSNATGIGAPYGMPMAQAVCPGRVAPASLRRVGTSTNTAYSASALSIAASSVSPMLRNTQDLGLRNGSSPTRIVVGMRNTSTVAGDVQTVASALTSSGFTILKIFANNLVIDAQAPSSVVASYFHTELHNVVQGQAGTRYANINPVTVPSTIAPYVQAVVTDNLSMAIPTPITRRK
jgi:kumamolisin